MLGRTLRPLSAVDVSRPALARTALPGWSWASPFEHLGVPKLGQEMTGCVSLFFLSAGAWWRINVISKGPKFFGGEKRARG